MTKHPKIYINHIGFQCNAKKELVVDACGVREFIVQDMSKVIKEVIGECENWKSVMRGRFFPVSSHMGDYMVGDFSELKTPGLYRIYIPKLKINSSQFFISDGVFTHFPRLFLDHIHSWRSGNFQNFLRGPSHLDDAIRSDTSEQVDVTGGWYDAGDLRKWMVHTNLPAIGFMDVANRLGWKWNHFASEQVSDNDLMTETAWALKFMIKMQDQGSGMFFEDVGGGGGGKMDIEKVWWYENHAGCAADNADNHFTDNIPESGDERTVRVQYNPIVQYTTIAILMRAAGFIKADDPELAKTCKDAAVKCWHFMEQKKHDDPFHTWTSVISWRLMAVIELCSANIIKNDVLEDTLNDLLSLQSEDFGFWFMDKQKNDPYRGILHSAQPVIALATMIERFPAFKMNSDAIDAIIMCWEHYILPATDTNPFDIIPYGTYFKPPNKTDVFRRLNEDLLFRFYMPENAEPPINHGLSGHWTSWAHALALAGKVLNDKGMTDLAWKQLYWLVGNNPFKVSFISGVGYNNPMPHSRFLGTNIGGFMVGPRGDTNDDFFVDMDHHAEWNSTEYWNTLIANSLMALSILLPPEVENSKKIGCSV